MSTTYDDCVGKKNLRRQIECKTGDFKFINHGNNILVYPASLTIEDVIMANYNLRSKIASLQQIVTIESIATQRAKVTKDGIKNVNYKILWPPGPDDLYMSNFKAPQLLDRF